MNGRFKDLMGRAKSMAEESTNRKISTNTELYVFAEQLSELILLDLINEFDESMTGQEDDVDYGLNLAKEIIKVRFGVE
jgi:hypothetical protein